MNRVDRILKIHSVPVCLFLVCGLGFSSDARGADEAVQKSDGVGVALAVNLPDAGPRHREMAVGIVAEAQRRWTMLEPQLTQEAVAACADEESCLVGLAKKRDASHLLSVGIAALDRHDFVVSVKLIELKNGRELVSHADIGKPGFHALNSGTRLAKSLFDAVPTEAEPAAAQSGALATADAKPASWKSITGWTLAAAAPLVAGTAAGLWFVSDDKQRTSVAITGAGSAAALICVSAALFAWDEFE